MRSEADQTLFIDTRALMRFIVLRYKDLQVNGG